MHPYKSPQTAPVASSTRFPFDPPLSPKSVRTCEKNQTLFTFDDYKEKDARKSSTESSSHDSSKDSQKQRSTRKDRYGNSKQGSPLQTSGYSKIENDNKNSAMFPFDREAIDYDRIQRECFTVEDETKFTHDFHITSKNYDKHSQYFDQIRSPSEVFHQYTLLSQEEKLYRSSLYECMSPVFHDHHYHQQSTSPRSTSPVPDFRVDFFAESSPLPAQQSSSSIFTAGSSSSSSSAQQDADIVLAMSQQKYSNNSSCGSVIHTTNNNIIMTSSGGVIGNNGVSCAAPNSGSCGGGVNTGGGPINVTSNPMDAAVYTQPRATIVVQQVN